MAVALATAVFALGVRMDLHESNALAFLLVKLAFGLAVVGLTSIYPYQAHPPGGEFHSWLALTTLSFLAGMILATINLTSAPPSHWKNMALGDERLQCLLSIPIIAIVRFTVIMWAVRLAAPTDLVRTGALAGLLAEG